MQPTLKRFRSGGDKDRDEATAFFVANWTLFVHTIVPKLSISELQQMCNAKLEFKQLCEKDKLLWRQIFERVNVTPVEPINDVIERGNTNMFRYLYAHVAIEDSKRLGSITLPTNVGSFTLISAEHGNSIKVGINYTIDFQLHPRKSIDHMKEYTDIILKTSDRLNTIQNSVFFNDALGVYVFDYDIKYKSDVYIVLIRLVYMLMDEFNAKHKMFPQLQPEITTAQQGGILVRCSICNINEAKYHCMDCHNRMVCGNDNCHL